MSLIEIRPATAEDLPAIAQLEAACFPPQEAASPEQFQARFAVFPQCFFVAEEDGQLIGQINGCVHDAPLLPDALYHDAELHQPEGAWQTVFGLTVHPQAQHRGAARLLLARLAQEAQAQGRAGVVLTCKDRLIGFYESMGYRCMGQADSTHGGAQWNLMVLTFAQ